MRFIDSASWKQSKVAKFPSREQCHGARGLIQQPTPALSQFIQACFGVDCEHGWSVLSEPYRDLLIQQGTHKVDGRFRRLDRRILDEEAAALVSDIDED